MSLDYKTFEDVDKKDLLRLIENRVPEDITMDYKQKLDIQKPRDKKEFLKDISSFANTQGGCIIYGMKERSGIASELCGVTLDNPETEKLRLVNLIRDGLEARAYGIDIKDVPLGNGKYALVIWIPRSFNPPHMVTVDGHRKFYGRSSTSNYPLGVEELRILFGFADAIIKEAKEFRYDRICKIKSSQSPIPLLEGPKYVLHLIPFGSFRADSNYDLSQFDNNRESLPTILWPVSDGRYNFDGFVTYRGFYNPDNPSPGYSYTQMFRNGIIEAVYMDYNPKLEGNVDKAIDKKYEEQMTEHGKEYLSIQQNLGISPPVFVMVSLIGVRGVRIGQRDRPADEVQSLRGSVPFAQDDLILPEVMFSNFDTSNIEQQMRQVFDVVLNAAGLRPADV